jgi:hypothetical protein
VLLVDFIDWGDTVNAKHDCYALDQLQHATCHKLAGLLQKGVIMLHDNARPNTAICTRELLQGYEWDVLDHPPHSPNLTPSDFHLSRPLKEHLSGARFATDSNMQHTVISWLKVLDTDFFHTWTDALVSQQDKCLNICGDCGKVMCIKVSCVIHAST